MKFITRALGADHRRPGGHLQGPEAAWHVRAKITFCISVGFCLLSPHISAVSKETERSSRVWRSGFFPALSPALCGLCQFVTLGPCETLPGCHGASPNTPGFLQAGEDVDHLEDPSSLRLARAAFEKGVLPSFFFFFFDPMESGPERTNHNKGQNRKNYALQGILCYC